LALIPFALVIVCAASADLDGKSSIWTAAPMVALGEWSYCMYLFHFTLIAFVAQHVGVGSGIGFFAQSLALTAVISAFVCHFVEKPLAKRFSRRRSPTSAG
jgi:peptidoglycan/LPS O-acetylase OafA/YrhL